MSTVDPPRDLPGNVREPDADLGVDALDALRARIAAHVDESQGAWARSSLFMRAWPLAIGVVAAAVWSGTSLAAGGVGVAAALAWASSIAAFVAVGRAPLHPAFAERVARLALAGAFLALAAEVGLSWSSAPVEGGTIMQCSRTVLLGAVLPALSLALYVRRSRAPARLFHVVALAGAAFSASAAAVWIGCPSTIHEHVLVSHVAVPVVVAGVVAAILRPLLRGAPLSR